MYFIKGYTINGDSYKELVDIIRETISSLSTLSNHDYYSVIALSIE